MALRPLVISPQERKAVNELVAFASKKENWYDPSKHNWSPGDREEYRIILTTYRTVFTFTKMPNKPVFRHLSISVPSGKLPHELAAYTIAEMFGFTGGKEERGIIVAPGKDWQIAIDERYPCITMAQSVGEGK